MDPLQDDNPIACMPRQYESTSMVHCMAAGNRLPGLCRWFFLQSCTESAAWTDRLLALATAQRQVIAASLLLITQHLICQPDSLKRLCCCVLLLFACPMPLVRMPESSQSPIRSFHLRQRAAPRHSQFGIPRASSVSLHQHSPHVTAHVSAYIMIQSILEGRGCSLEAGLDCLMSWQPTLASARHACLLLSGCKEAGDISGWLARGS